MFHLHSSTHCLSLYTIGVSHGSSICLDFRLFTVPVLGFIDYLLYHVPGNIVVLIIFAVILVGNT